MSRKKFKTHLCKLCSENIGSDSFVCTNCNSNFHKLCLLPSRVDPDNWAENNVCPFFFHSAVRDLRNFITYF